MEKAAYCSRFIWALPLLLGLNFVHAAFDFHPVFRIMDVSAGLPDRHVEAIVQDIHGYVWIGTRSGLVRHEGRELNQLPRDPQHPASLPDNNIMSLHAHSDGMVWAGVAGAGAVEIGPDLIPRRHLAPRASGGILPQGHIWSMAEDCEGRIWFAFMRGGVARFDPATERLISIPQQAEYGLTPEGFQTKLAVDRECRVWLAQSERVSVMASADDQPRFEEVLAGGPDTSSLILTLLDHSELGMLAARGSDLFVVTAGDNIGSGTAAPVLVTVEGLVVSLGELPDGRIMASTTQGLNFFDPATGILERVTARPDLPDALPTDLLAAAMVDREGGVWVAVPQRGLVYLPPEHAVFSRLHRGFSPNADAILDRVNIISPAAESSRFWIGAQGGVQRLDLANAAIEDARDFFPDFPPEPLNRLFRGFWERPDGLVVLEPGSLWWLSPQAGQSEILLHRFGLEDTNLSFLYPDDPDALWMGTVGDGVVHLDLPSRQVRRYGPDQPSPMTLPESTPHLMIRDPEGQLILAGPSTLYRLTEEQGFVPVVRLERGRISDLAFAKDGSLWIAKDAGVSQWRWGVDQAEQLLEPNIGDIVERASLRRVFPIRDDEIWLVLSSGVARLNPLTGQTRLFTRSDGLAPDEFPPQASAKLPDGRIVLGGNRGLIFVNPDRVRAEPVAPPVHLARVSAGDFEQMLVPGRRPPLALDWRQNAVRFEFSALTFVAPERLRYRVRLHGWDDDWVELREVGRMYYSNLRSGTYRFEVQAATDAGRWSAAGDSVVIELASPPWASPPAFAAYAGFLLIGMAASWRGVRQSRRRRRHLQEIQQKRDLAEGQRKLLERLNEDLEPIPLARAIVAEMLRLTAASRACFGYVHEQMPRQLVTVGDSDPPSRDDWLTEIRTVDNQRSQLVELKADRDLLARVVLYAPDGGFQPDHEQRLALLVDLAGQALHNSLLLERVKRLAERAEAANHAKSEFLATMSHEIRTPLHGVMGMADLLHERETEPDRLELINTLRTSGRQLQRVIDDVLDISRIEAGRLSIKQEPFELVSVLEHVIDLHAPNAARKHLDLRLQIQADLPIVALGDADRLAQVLGNLLSNAVKFTDHGAIEMAAIYDQRDHLKFAVRDTGPGISAEEKQRLFEPFSQLDASIRRLHGGSGLGLAISRRLAEAMGGHLELQSRSWPGSTFMLSLPHSVAVRQRPMTQLLDDVVVTGLLDPPTFRVLLRCARRWGFRACNGWRREPDPEALLLVDPRVLVADATAHQWLSTCRHGFFLQSPYTSADAADVPMPANFLFLRWPLVEGRLIAALFDWVLEQKA